MPSQFFTTEIAPFQNLHLITVKSNALSRRADLSVFVPPSSQAVLPIVILLHGVYGSHWAWAVCGKAHETAQALIHTGQIRPMILAMPSDGLYGDGSGYVPHRDADYEKWIVEEVVQVVKEQFPQATDASPVFIAGLSMGGYGALRLGAKYPARFRAFAGLSSITHFEQIALFVKDFKQLKNDALEQDGVLDWMLKHQTTLPPFRFDCGDEDVLIEYNRQLHSALEQEGILHQYEEFPGGHSWGYWEEHLRETLLFFDRYL